MKKRNDPSRGEPEQFEAYGRYAYEYDPPQEPQQRENSRRKAEETPAPTPEQSAERARARSRAVTNRLIFVLALAVLALIVLQNTLFKLKTVYVVGNVTKTPQQVAAASGLVKGLNMFSINEDEVRKNLSGDHTIVLLGLQKEYPSTVYLYISERESVASLQWLGLLYTLDKDGIVMSEDNTTALPSCMPTVVGLQVTSIRVGQKLEVRNQAQMEAYYQIVSELDLQIYQDQITEMDLSDTDNLFLQTASGISVRLGTSEYMRAKIGAIRTDIPYLEQLGKTSGVLDVSTPEDAKYSPDS